MTVTHSTVATLPDEAGIYAIVHVPSGMRYVGSAASMRRRQRQHLRQLQDGSHVNKRLARAWAKHGSGEFSFEALLICDRKHLLMYEQRVIDGYNACRSGFNLCPLAGSNAGVKIVGRKMPPQSDISRLRKSLSHSGKKGLSPSKETRQKISDALKKRVRGPQSDEHRQKLSLAHLGKKLTPEHRAAISSAHKGKIKTAEHRIALSVSHLRRRTALWP